MADRRPTIRATSIPDGNGTFDTLSMPTGFQARAILETVLLTVNRKRGLTVADYFEMSNQQEETTPTGTWFWRDAAAARPDRRLGKVWHLAVGAGKDRISTW